MTGLWLALEIVVCALLCREIYSVIDSDDRAKRREASLERERLQALIHIVHAEALVASAHKVSRMAEDRDIHAWRWEVRAMTARHLLTPAA